MKQSSGRAAKAATALPPFDPAAPDGFERLLAAMCFPKHRRQAETVVTWHLKAIACAPKLGRLVQEIGKERATAAVATAMELNPKALRFAPWTAEYLAQMADPEAAQQSLKNVPGWEDVAADAPGADRLHAEFEKAAREGTFIAGRLLLIVASLVEHHREVDASLARAIAVLVEAKRRKPFLPIPDPRHIKEVWKRWRCVVPLWAATIAASEHLADSTPGFSTAEGATEVLLMPAGRMAVLGMAAWFRDFAIRFQPLNSGKRLLPERECAGMPAGTEVLKPPLKPLPDWAVQAARRTTSGGRYGWNTSDWD